MIVILNSATHEVQAIEATAEDFGDGYGPDWQFVRALGAGEDPAWLAYDAEAGAVACDLARLDLLLHARIDAEAGAVRMRFITDVAGQELTYQRKESEARAWVADPEMPLAALPFLSAEMAATGADAATCAATIIAAADAWAAIGSAIEGARIGAKRAVSAAMTAAAKEAAAVVDWDAAVAGAQVNE